MSSAGTTATPTQYWEVPYTYELDFLALLPNSQANSNIQIQADSDFKWLKSSVFATTVAGVLIPATDILASLQIIDSGTGRQLFSNPVPIPSNFGSAQLPFILPVPYIFKARSNIAFTVLSLDSVNTINLYLSLIGTKIFRSGQ